MMPNANAPTPPTDLAQRDAEDLQALARLLDSQFKVPGLPIRFGLDALLGLAPVVGDVASAAIGLYIIARAHRLGAPPPLLRKMMRRLAVDTALGSVPVAGDLFDFAYRSNSKNVAALLKHCDAPVTPKRDATREILHPPARDRRKAG